MKDKISIIGIIIFGVLLYGLTIHGVWGNPGPALFKNNLDQPAKPFELSPERGRYSHIFTLAENHTYTLGQDWADVVYPDVGVHNGKYYSFFAPGTSYMAVPFYLLGKTFNLGQVFAFALISLFSIGGLICIYKIGRNILSLPVWTSLFSAFVFGFASTSWSYAVTLYQHHITTFLILLSFYAVWKFRKHTSYAWLWAIIVGLSYALAVFVDYPNAVLLLPVMIYFVVSLFSFYKEKVGYVVSVRFIGGLALVAFFALTSLHFYHNYYYYGSWKTLSGALPSYHLPSATATSTTSATTTPLSAVEIAKNTPVEKNVVGFFTEEHVPHSFYTLIFSTDRGLFFFCPIFLLALIGIFLIRKKLSTEHLVLLSIVATNVFLYSSWGDPWGGWAFGPRYLIPTMSVLSLFVGVFVSSRPYQGLKKCITLLFTLFGSFIGLLGVLTTNAVPPQIEAVLLPVKKYNFLKNLDFLKEGESNSFLFNAHFSNSLSLLGYFVCIYASLVVLMVVLLFILPIFEDEDLYE